MAEWFERFFKGLYVNVLLNTFDERASRAQAVIVKRLLGLRKGRRALDVPCGMGRLTLPLARMGLEMTGVDLTAGFLRRARRRARREGVTVRYIQSDMRRISFDAEFDAVINWFGSFGYFSDADNLAFLRRVFEALRPGGRFLVESINKSWLIARFRAHSVQTVGGVKITHDNRWDARAGRVRSVWRMQKGAVTERHRIVMRIFNGAEMRALLREAGFRDIRLHGYPPVGRFTRHSRRLIAVATRP